jgi:hypothetical protein
MPSPFPRSPPTNPPPAKRQNTIISPIMSSSALPAARDLLIKRLSDRATLPTRGSKFAAGLDLYAYVPRHLAFASPPATRQGREPARKRREDATDFAFALFFSPFCSRCYACFEPNLMSPLYHAHPCPPSISAESKTVPANGKALIDTQLSMAIPYGTYGRIAPRSGLGALSPLNLFLYGLRTISKSAIDFHHLFPLLPSFLPLPLPSFGYTLSTLSLPVALHPTHTRSIMCLLPSPFCSRQTLHPDRCGRHRR